MAEFELEAIDSVITEVKGILKNGDNVPAEVARRLLLTISVANHECNRETVSEVRKINGRLKKVEEAVDDWRKHPSLLWLLHHKTKITVSVIVVVFALLSAFYVSGIRAVIMEWLGLPPLIP
jgi:hypothetical protein